MKGGREGGFHGELISADICQISCDGYFTCKFQFMLWMWSSSSLRVKEVVVVAKLGDSPRPDPTPFEELFLCAREKREATYHGSLAT